MKNWNESSLKKLESKGLLSNLDQLPKHRAPFQGQKLSLEKQSIETVLFVLHREEKIPEYVRELQFHHERKFRFDWAIPKLKIAIEYEGIFSEKSGHTTISGHTKDCDKYNLAGCLG